jgi:pyruvate,water dikinase
MLLSLIMKSGSADARPSLVPFNELVSGLPGRHRSLGKLFMKAGRFKLYREKISSLFIFGHGLFRYLFLGAGASLVSEGLLEVADDVFYLYKDEVDSLIRKSYPDPTAVRTLVAQRKSEIELTRDYVLPSVIYGDTAPLLEIGKVRNHYGTGTSAGSFTGITRVVRGSADFESVSRGDILLIPFSDVSWTPILTLAGAIVAETGGMLSHFSIIAREMGVPALSSIDNACALGNGLKATVDGSNGILTIHDYE